MTGIAQDRLIRVPNISAETDLSAFFSLLQPDLNRRRAQQMPHIGKPNRHIVIKLDLFPVLAGAKLFQNSFRVLHRIKRFDFVRSAAFCLSVFPFRLRLLNVGTVTQHDLAQIFSRFAGIYQTTKSLFI